MEKTFIPAIPSIPKVPLIMSSNIALKKLKCLNLKEFPNSQFKENSIFNYHNEIILQENLLEEFFKVKENNSSSKRDSETNSLSDKKGKKENISTCSLIDQNKFTAYYVSIRKLNTKIKFNLLVENIQILFIESEVEEALCEEILCMLQSQEIVSSIYGILPTDNEMRTISSEIMNIHIDESTGDTEKWILKCSECEQIKKLIEILMNFFNIQNNLIEISTSLENYLDIYGRIFKNKNLKLLLNIILKIDNLICKETGKKQLSHFDIRNLNILSELKINSKSFLQFAFKIYSQNIERILKFSPSQKDVKIFDAKDCSLFILLLEPYNSLNILSSEISRIKEELITDIDKLQIIVKNKFCLNKFSDILISLDDQLQILILKLDNEKEERLRILEYFNFSSEGNHFEFVSQIFKNLLALENKLQIFIKDLPLSVSKKENPENNFRGKSQTTGKNIKYSESLTQTKPLSTPSTFLNLKYKLK